jgi:hypothetical protein
MTTRDPLTVVMGFGGFKKFQLYLTVVFDLTFIAYVVARDLQQIITPNLSLFVNNCKKPAQQVNTYWSKQHQTSKLK